MYNSDYRIYTIDQITDVLLGKYVDPTFMILIEEDEYEKMLNIKYPFFKKPTYVTYDPLGDEDYSEE